MPTYDYNCEACGHNWEMFQRMSDDPVKKCPECKKNKACRLFGTGAAIVFKGSGFYQTDYRTDSYKSGEKAARKDSDKKSDSKSGDSSGKPNQSTKSSDGSNSSPKNSSDAKPNSDSSTPKNKKRDS